MTAPPRPNPVHITAPVTGTPYLIETDDGDGNSAVRLLTYDSLIKWLTEDIEHRLYSGDDYPTPTIFRYEPSDGDTRASLTELVMSSAGCTNDGDDWLRYSYLLHERADGEAFGFCEENKVAEFSVRIDGRV